MTLLTVRELAGILQVSEREVYRLALRGDLPGYRVGRGWRFRLEEVLEALRPKESA